VKAHRTSKLILSESSLESSNCIGVIQKLLWLRDVDSLETQRIITFAIRSHYQRTGEDTAGRIIDYVNS
jgi:hypothetical protein